MADESEYSLDLRVSLDGYDAPTNDAIRGDGSFVRILRGIGNLVSAGINPVVTVTEACPDAGKDEGKQRFFELLGRVGIDKPRLKILPLFRTGAEVGRGGGYADWQRIEEGEDWSHLQCSSSRMATGRGVWVCPILVNEPSGKMGETLSESLDRYPLNHSACWTCHVQGATCRT
jgi:MoaA/NifB/PqqE/SkfB family radical SAM enzyme